MALFLSGSHTNVPWYPGGHMPGGFVWVFFGVGWGGERSRSRALAAGRAGAEDIGK